MSGKRKKNNIILYRREKEFSAKAYTQTITVWIMIATLLFGENELIMPFSCFICNGYVLFFLSTPV